MANSDQTPLFRSKNLGFLTNKPFVLRILETTALTTSVVQQPTAQVRSVEDLVTPCYVGYKSIIQRNSERMLRQAQMLGCQLRPHMKTHKTIQGAAERC